MIQDDTAYGRRPVTSRDSGLAWQSCQVFKSFDPYIIYFGITWYYYVLLGITWFTLIPRWIKFDVLVLFTHVLGVFNLLCAVIFRIFGLRATLPQLAPKDGATAVRQGQRYDAPLRTMFTGDSWSREPATTCKLHILYIVVCLLYS